MVNAARFKELALSFPGAEEVSHFERAAFKVTGRKIFATLLEKEQTANLLLSISDQSVYCAFDDTSVYSVPNKFGLQGWTTFDLKRVPAELVSDALLMAYKNILHTKPAKKSK